MRHIDIGKDSERFVCKCRIEGRYNGEDFIYEDIHSSDGFYFYWVKDGDPSRYWWEEGNMSCDCNRHSFLPFNLQKIHNGECGKSIRIKRIIPLEGDNFPVVELNEY